MIVLVLDNGLSLVPPASQLGDFYRFPQTEPNDTGLLLLRATSRIGDFKKSNRQFFLQLAKLATLLAVFKTFMTSFYEWKTRSSVPTWKTTKLSQKDTETITLLFDSYVYIICIIVRQALTRKLLSYTGSFLYLKVVVYLKLDISKQIFWSQITSV